jgi:outer membrane lipoprotein carrier protein
MKIVKSTAFCLAAALALWVQAGQAAQTGTARQSLDTYLKDFKTLTAHFSQTVTNEKGKVIENSEGEVYLQRPGKFRWDYRSPYEQSIIGDGKKVWIYDKDLEQVTIKPMDKVMGSTPALILGSDANIDENFKTLELGSSDGLNWIELTPKRADREYTGIKLGFDKGELRQMKLSDNFGQVTALQFSDVKRNAPVDPAKFSFTPPAGVDVNDLSGGP